MDRRPLGRAVPACSRTSRIARGPGARAVPAAWHRAILVLTEGGAHETRVSSVPGLSTSGIIRRGWVSQVRMRRLRSGRGKTSRGETATEEWGLRYQETGREAD